MKMIQCHAYNGNQKIFISIDRIEFFKEAEYGADIFMKSGRWIAVNESFTDIQNMIYRLEELSAR